MDRTDITASQLNTWINYAQRQICEAFNYDFMQKQGKVVTEDGQRTYILPSDYKDERTLEMINQDDQRVPLYKYTKEQLENEFKDTTKTGIPKYYCFSQQAIFLYPLPDHSKNGGNRWIMNIEYYGYVDDLVNDTDETELTKKYPQFVMHMTLSEAFDFIYEEEKAQYYYKKAISEFQDIRHQQLKSRLSERLPQATPVQGQSLG